MRAITCLKDHPVLLLGVAVVGLVAWVAADTPRAPAPLPDETPAAIPAGPWALSGPAADPPGGSTSGRHEAGLGAVSALLVNRLFPGMTRREVEDLLGPPPAERVGAVGRDRLSYRTTYAVRPVGSVDAPLLALEFDASRPGHPLLKVHRPECF